LQKRSVTDATLSANSRKEFTAPCSPRNFVPMKLPRKLRQCAAAHAGGRTSVAYSQGAAICFQNIRSRVILSAEKISDYVFKNNKP
jgi:hypothetical protein